MNKAFVKEEDTSIGRCPRCGSPGSPVLPETLSAQVLPEALKHLSETAFFCPFARCSVVYFDLFERVVEEPSVRSPVYPKNPEAPLCACFGLTCDDVDEDLREGGVQRTRACVERAKTDEAQCTLRSPSGQSCITEVQRYYMQRLAATR
jgi:Zinc binding domain